MSECDQRNPVVFGLEIYQGAQRCCTSRLPGLGIDRFAALSYLVSHLSLLPRHDAFSGHWTGSSDLFHYPDDSHHTRSGNRATRRADLVSRASRGLRATPAHRPRDASSLDVRVDYGRDRLSYALPDLSFLNRVDD